MQNTTISFIGSGNMATSLISGLINDGFSPQQLWASNTLASKLEELRQQFAIHTTESNIEAVQHGKIIILGVKPNNMKSVCLEIANTVQKNKPLVITIAAGVRIDDIQAWLGGAIPIVRCMPNTPALINCGATGLYSNSLVNEEQKNLAESIMRSVGVVVWLDHEKLLDTVTALSGSGPAYFFLIIEALEQAAIQLGLPADTAHLLTVQTALGAAKMALESNQSTAELRHHVTSPGGTTESALAFLEKNDVVTLIQEALRIAERRSNELGSLFGK